MLTVVRKTTVGNNGSRKTLPKSQINPAKFRFIKVQPRKFFLTKERPSWLENVKNYFCEYCNLSGLHGVRYLAESGRFIVEKLVWMIVLIVMGYFCISLISEAYSKWRASPVIITFATTETPISKIPFPAVTICPEIKSDPDIFNYSEVLLRKLNDSYVTSEENEIFESVSLVCPGMIVTLELDDDFMENINPTVSPSVITNMFNVSPHADVIVPNLWWMKNDIVNDDVLTNIYTSQGICYSFNMIDPNHLQTNTDFISWFLRKYQNPYATQAKLKGWSLADGYVNEDTTDDFPRRTFGSGVSGGLRILLVTNHSHIDRLCSDDNEGFLVTIHHPAEFPNMDTHFRVPLDQTVSVAVKPTLITVSEELINYKPEDRKCYFSNERNLTYFYSYSQQNCLDECLTNYTIQYCGCVAFYMPKSKSFPICGPGRFECIQKSRINYLLNNSSDTTDCNCLPLCTSLKYEVEISQSNWAWRESMIIEKTLDNNSRDIFSSTE
ncbi:hypothetical protein ILUMI_09711, partial [Ignelater luminosus]